MASRRTSTPRNELYNNQSAQVCSKRAALPYTRKTISKPSARQACPKQPHTYRAAWYTHAASGPAPVDDGRRNTHSSSGDQAGIGTTAGTLLVTHGAGALADAWRVELPSTALTAMAVCASTDTALRRQPGGPARTCSGGNRSLPLLAMRLVPYLLDACKQGRATM
jgi:hypothetical protein